MKIRLQILLALAPIFLGLGLVVSFLNYTTRMYEVESGFREEIFALAVSVSEFLGNEETRVFLNGGGGEGNRMNRALRMVLERNPVERLELFESSSAGSSFLVDKMGAEAKPIQLCSQEELTPIRAGVLASQIRTIPDRAPLATVLAPVKDELGPFAVLAMHVDAREIQVLRQSVMGQSVALLIGVLICCVLIAHLMGRLVTWPIRDLIRVTEAVTGTQQGDNVKQGYLREFNDLGNTFNTMVSLLRGILSKTKRAVFEGEQFRGPSDLAQAFAHRVWSRRSLRFGKIGVRIVLLGERSGREFVGSWRKHDRAHIVMGRVSVSDDLESVVTSSAVLTLVEEQLAKGGVDHGFETATKFFSFRFWKSVSWTEGDEGVSVWSYHSDRAEPIRREIQLEANHPLTLHSLEGDWVRKLELYVGVLEGLEGELLLDELAGLLEDSPEGGIAILLALDATETTSSGAFMSRASGRSSLSL